MKFIFSVVVILIFYRPVFGQNGSFLLYDGRAKIDLIDSSTMNTKKHDYQFTITNLSKDYLYLIGSGDILFTFSAPYADNSGLFIGFGAKMAPINSYYSDSVEVIIVNPGESLSSDKIEFTYSLPSHTLELGFDLFFDEKKIVSKHILRTDYFSKTESVFFELSSCSE